MVNGRSLFAQVTQDQWMVAASTNLSLSSTSFDGLGDQRSINFTSKIGYFFRDNLALGVDIGVSSLDTGNSSQRELNLGLFTRYYFEKLFFAGVGYSVSQVQMDVDSVKRTINGGALSIEAGYPIWILIERLAIEPTLDYNIGMGSLLKGTNTLAFKIGFTLYF